MDYYFVRVPVSWRLVSKNGRFGCVYHVRLLLDHRKNGEAFQPTSWRNLWAGYCWLPLHKRMRKPSSTGFCSSSWNWKLLDEQNHPNHSKIYRKKNRSCWPQQRNIKCEIQKTRWLLITRAILIYNANVGSWKHDNRRPIHRTIRSLLSWKHHDWRHLRKHV